jgi:inositol-hexakisphosphate kinase
MMLYAASANTFTPRQRSTEESSGTPRQNMLDTREFGSALRGHREFLDRSTGGGWPLECSDRFAAKQEPLVRPKASATASEETLNRKRSSNGIEPSTSLRTVTIDMANAGDASAQPRRKLDHRAVTLGPEKAWSIGTGESSNSQDGKVEKSITEVLAGLEPNARSRKSSHSLRFFKEGLPEENIRRRETTRPSEQRRDTHSGERLADVIEGVPSGSGQTSPQPPEARSHIQRAKTFAAQSPKAPPIPESPEDYFQLRIDNRSRGVASPTELQVRTKPLDKDVRDTQTQQLPVAGDESEEHDTEGRRKSGDSTEVGESAEDGDDSSEEKISSAVFLPHQGPDEPAQASTPGPPRLGPGARTLSRADDFHPWLVKADEPEDEEQVEDKHHEHEGCVRSDFEGPPSAVIKEPTNHITEEPSSVEETEVGPYRAQPSRKGSQYYDEHIHEHQVKPKEPLDAIELIPYKHQVGGHTTIWRFSKRAVCKQLNNRENEFYEIVERDHPELLAFLPRFVIPVSYAFVSFRLTRL